MKSMHHVSMAGCGPCGLSRRQFLAGCAACAAAGSGQWAVGSGQQAVEIQHSAFSIQHSAKAKVRLLFTHVPSTGPIWPNIGYDFERRKKELIEKLSQAAPNVELLPATAQNPEEAKKILDADPQAGAPQADGYLVYMLGLWTGAPQVIGASGRPTIFVDDLYGGSGEFLIAYAAARRAKQKVAGVSSSRFGDVAEAVRCFEILKKPGKSVDDFLAACEAARRKGTKPVGDMSCPEDPLKTVSVDECLKRLKSSVILVVGRDPGGEGKAIEEIFGTKVVPLSHAQLHEAYTKIDRDEAAQWADRWINQAAKVIEPKREEIEKSGAMYLAMCGLMKQHNAQAISINCLGGFYAGQIKAYPCLGFFQLNNDGQVGACEADLQSTITMLALGYLTGRPGYISDPVIDTSKNQIIYAHCVAPNKVFGPEGPANPYHIRSHSEDRQGAVVRSLMPLGHMTTTVEINLGRREMIFHQGKSVENIDQDMACRSKLAVEVKGDIDKLLSYWDQWGWHRVTFYGDLKGPVEEISKALGLKMVIEA